MILQYNDNGDADIDKLGMLLHNGYLILAHHDRAPMRLDTILPGDTPQLLTREEDIERASRSLKAMSHPLRLKILCTLGDQEVSVQGIVENVGTSQSNISQHLAILRDKGILASRKDANRVYYRVGDARTLRLISMMQEVFCTS
jgi:DNA-binding transcriptional ArsR family regulator